MWDRNAASASPSEVLAAHEPVARDEQDASEMADERAHLLAPEDLRHLAAPGLGPGKDDRAAAGGPAEVGHRHKVAGRHARTRPDLDGEQRGLSA